jgi:exo-beta-1,3-glucanase (GH17 family)
MLTVTSAPLSTHISHSYLWLGLQPDCSSGMQTPCSKRVHHLTSFRQLEAIKQTKVEMEVFLGIYTVPDDLDAYSRQRDAVMDALKEYGADHVAGVTVGNEFMLK